MRNLKKVLALVLVFAMAFTMVSFAALEDVAGSDYENQIRTNVALGIIKGKDTGNFDPTGDVTRAEMAKMVYVMLKGKDDGAVIYKGASDLKDVKGTWAEGYINYCYSLDIIAGRGNGIFDPNAKVTAAEACKMILAALGWDAETEGLVGASWAIKSVARAEKEDILDNFAEDGDIMGALNREGAANLIYNALFADTVIYESYGENKGWLYREDSLAETVFELIEADAYLAKTEIVGLGGASAKGTTTFDVIGSDDDVIVADTTADFNNLGRIFTIYYKEDVSKADKDLTANATLFTAIYSDDNKVIATTGGSFAKDAGKFKSSTGTNLSTGITEYGMQDSSNAYDFLGTGWDTDKTYINGNLLGAAGSIELPAYKTGLPVYLLTDADKAAPKKIKGLGPQNAAEVGYEYTSDKYNYVIAFVPTFMEVTAVTTKNITFKDKFANTTVMPAVENISYNGITGVEKGDYVLVYSMNGGNKYVVTECPAVTGTVVGFDGDKKPILSTGAVLGTSGFKSSDVAKRKVGIPGTTYVDSTALQNATSPYIGKEVTFYTDGKYVVYAESTEEGMTKNYLVAMKDTIGADKANLAGTKWNLYATALLADGSEKEVEITKVDGVEVSTKTTEAAALLMLTGDKAYTYTVTDGKYQLTPVAGTSAFDGTTLASYMKDTGAFKSGANYYYITKDTAVFVKKGLTDDVEAVTAADIKKDFTTFDEDYTVTVAYKAGTLGDKVANLEYVYITTDADLTNAASDYKFARALTDGQYLYNTTEKKFYGTIKLFVDGEVKTVVSDADLDSAPTSFAAAKTFMAVGFDGDKIKIVSNALDLKLLDKTSDLSKLSDATYRDRLNAAYGLQAGDDDYGKLYVVTTSAASLNGSLLFTKWDDVASFDKEFVIDEDTVIYGFNSVAGTVAANEIVTRGDYFRNVTVIYSHDDKGTATNFNDDVLTARYILVDAGLAEAKNATR